MSDRPPSEIARETFKILASKRLPPTPENYQSHYHEVAGTVSLAHFPSEQLRQIAAALPAKNPGQEKHLGLLMSAINQRSWDKVQAALLGFAGFGVVTSAPTPAVPTTRPAALPETDAPPEWLGQVARLIDSALPALGSDDPRFVEQAIETARVLRHPIDAPPDLRAMLGNLAHRMTFVAEDQAEIRAALLRLLQRVFENIGVLCIEDGWLRGQLDALRTSANPPLSLRRLDDVERRFKDVIFRQTEARGRASEAQAQMRQLLAAFVDRLSMMSESSSVYHGKIEQCARAIEGAQSLEELGPVLQDVISATRAMASDTLQSRDELYTMRVKTEQAEAEIAKLHHELDRVSAQARHDALTGVLNRRGLDEALDREVATTRRRGHALCVALLDLDNFKKINDQLGHEGGDAALAHLAEVARDSVRPQDSLARYGGEEFVVVLPDTLLDAGIAVLTRLQRELTKAYFLRDNEKVLITFSAGVVQVGATEDVGDALKRADTAMYLAKRSGKNRVLGG